MHNGCSCSLLLLVRDQLEAIRALLILGEHDGDAIGKRLVLQGDGRAFAALIGPDGADTRPDFLATLVFAGGLAVIDKMGRCVWHIVSV